MRLSDSKILEELTNEEGWIFQRNAIVKTFSFSSYMNGIEFVRQLAAKAELYNHHPDLTVGWRKVTVLFTSHDAGGVTERDIAMMKETENVRKTLP